MKKNAVSITEHLTCLDPLDEHNSRQLIGMRLTRAKTLVAEKGNSFQKIFLVQLIVDSRFKISESSLPLTRQLVQAEQENAMLGHWCCLGEREAILRISQTQLI